MRYYTADLEPLINFTPPLVAVDELDTASRDALVDVRAKNEYAAGTIPGAQQLSGGSALWRLDELPAPGSTLLTFCQSGVRNSVVAVQLRTRSDLLLTAVSHTMSLIPGSVVVEVDRSLSVLYFHVLNTSTPEEIERFTRQVAYFEDLIIKAAGSREEYEALKQDEEADRTASRKENA